MIFTKLLKRCLLIGGNEEEVTDNEIESWEGGIITQTQVNLNFEKKGLLK